jgi:glutamyl-tRNA synthetase
VTRLDDFTAIGRFFFADAVDYEEAAVAKHLRQEGMAEHLVAVATAFREMRAFDVASTEEALRAVAGSRGVKAATLIHAVRVAVTGTTVSPGLFEVLALVGRDRTLSRLAAALRLISSTRRG